MIAKIRLTMAAVILGLVSAVTGQGVASASPTGEDFAAQVRAAGLSAEQAAGLQSKVDAYLLQLGGRGTQVSPNQIDMKGAILYVTVPGERQPRQLSQVSRAQYPDGCKAWDGSPGAAHPGWFCAFERAYYQGDAVGMYQCDNYFIPFNTVGSWQNNQTPGTRPLLYFRDFSTWLMPAAYSSEFFGVDWYPVNSITNC